MGVDVDVGDTESVAPQRKDREHGVVQVAESRRAGRHRVMEAPREVERARHVASRHQLGGEDRAPAGERRGLVAPGPDRVVAGAQAIPVGLGHGRAGAGGPEDGEVLVRVELPECRVRRGRRREHLRIGEPREPVGIHQGERQAEPLHAERVLRPVVEALVGVRVDEGGLQRRIQWPLRPPDFSTRQRSVSRIPRSMAFTMS